MAKFGFIFLLAIVVFLSGCAVNELTVEEWRDPGVAMVWPPPPSSARIELLRVIKEESDLQKGEKGNRILRWLLGDKGNEPSLISPYGISSDGKGRIWIADPGSGIVQVFDLRKKTVNYIGQVGGMSLVSPVDVAYDLNSENIYISDSRIKKVFVLSPKGNNAGVISPINGFGRPAGLSVDKDGQLYVVDALKGVVEVFSPDGVHLKTVGSASSGTGFFRNPSNVHVDDLGRIYVVDSLRFRVEVQDAKGVLLSVIGGLGDSFGKFARPRGVAVDSHGHIYVVDAAFDNVQIFDMAGRLLLFFAGPGSGAGEFCLPAGIHIDRNDRIYVAESCNQRFQIFQFLGID